MPEEQVTSIYVQTEDVFRATFTAAFKSRRSQLVNVMQVTPGLGKVFLYDFLDADSAPQLNIDRRLGNSLVPISRLVNTKVFGNVIEIDRITLNNNGEIVATAARIKFIESLNKSLDRVVAVTSTGRGEFLNTLTARGDADYSTQELIRGRRNITRIPNYSNGRLTVGLEDNTAIDLLSRFTLKNTATNNAITLNDLYEIKVDLYKAAGISATLSLFLMIHPDDLENLYKDSTLSHRIIQSQDQAETTGYRESVIGFNIIPNVYMTIGQAVCFTSRAMTLVLNEFESGFKSKIQSAGSLEIGTYMTMGAAVMKEQELIVVNIRR